DRRHDDRRACGTLDCCDVRHSGRLPAQAVDAFDVGRSMALVSQDWSMISPKLSLAGTEVPRIGLGTNRLTNRRLRSKRGEQR
ncbi:MAG TPA: hypothetical protein VGS60_18570, partial [Actinomycetes bacterium]|nr:hypothetical protein [Actinomycetes bacterium]